VKGSKRQVLLSAMAERAAPLTDREANESLIIRLEKSREKTGLVLAS
jgi:hypothetical protein